MPRRAGEAEDPSPAVVSALERGVPPSLASDRDARPPPAGPSACASGDAWERRERIPWAGNRGPTRPPPGEGPRRQEPRAERPWWEPSGRPPRPASEAKAPSASSWPGVRIGERSGEGRRCPPHPRRGPPRARREACGRGSGVRSALRRGAEASSPHALPWGSGVREASGTPAPLRATAAGDREVRFRGRRVRSVRSRDPRSTETERHGAPAPGATGEGRAGPTLSGSVGQGGAPSGRASATAERTAEEGPSEARGPALRRSGPAGPARAGSSPRSPDRSREPDRPREAGRLRWGPRTRVPPRGPAPGPEQRGWRPRAPR